MCSTISGLQFDCSPRSHALGVYCKTKTMNNSRLKELSWISRMIQSNVTGVEDCLKSSRHIGNVHLCNIRSFFMFRIYCHDLTLTKANWYCVSNLLTKLISVVEDFLKVHVTLAAYPYVILVGQVLFFEYILTRAKRNASIFLTKQISYK